MATLSVSRARKKRLLLFGLLFSLAAACLAFILITLSNNIVFYYTPSELFQHPEFLNGARQVRIGGLVVRGSLKKGADGLTHFLVTDFKQTLSVSTTAPLPSLFAEGAGAVIEGAVDRPGHLQATTVLAKHDENYKPKSLNKS